MRKRVVILRIHKYDKDLIREKISQALYKYFSIDSIKKEDNILLKPNLLMPVNPYLAITTHPTIIEAVGCIFKERGNSVFVADCPGGFLNKNDLNYVYKETGVFDISLKNDFKLLYPESFFTKNNLPLCWWVNQFKMINIPKLKTHSLTTLSLATKNLYGCIYGDFKSFFHLKLPKPKDFIKIIIDLYKNIKPFLNIVDGILGLEGNGPARGGRPKNLGLIFIGDDPLYTDYAISKFFKIKDRFNPLIKTAKEMGLIFEKDLEIISDLKDINVNLKLPSVHILNYFPNSLISFLKSFLKFYPKIDNGKCKFCFKCKNYCPKNAIYVKENGELGINLKKCIMCMCCIESCKFGAINLDRGFILKIIGRL